MTAAFRRLVGMEEHLVVFLRWVQVRHAPFRFDCEAELVDAKLGHLLLPAVVLLVPGDLAPLYLPRYFPLQVRLCYRSSCHRCFVRCTVYPPTDDVTLRPMNLSFHEEKLCKAGPCSLRGLVMGRGTRYCFREGICTLSQDTFQGFQALWDLADWKNILNIYLNIMICIYCNNIRSKA